MISADELKNASKALSRLDRNRDGKITRDEMYPRQSDNQGGRDDFRRPGGPGQGDAMTSAAQEDQAKEDVVTSAAQEDRVKEDVMTSAAQEDQAKGDAMTSAAKRTRPRQTGWPFQPARPKARRPGKKRSVSSNR